METSAGAVLVVHSGDSRSDVIPLDQPRHVLGRAPLADVAFDNPFISRRHAEISCTGEEYFIRDLGSKNGTFVDGRPVGGAPLPLAGSEIIELGQDQVVVTFRLGSSTVTLPAEDREQGGTALASASQAPAAGLVVDGARREVFVDNAALVPPLSKKEFDVLLLLFERAGQACSKDDIAARGWPERPAGAVSDQEISQCVHRIRRRVESDPSAPRFIMSIRGFGYRLAVDG